VHAFTVEAARALAGPDWLVARRIAAAEEFASTPMPTAAAEEWRYSPISQLDLDAYRLAGTGGGADSSSRSDGAADRGAELVSLTRLVPQAAAVVDVVNGRVTAARGLEKLADKGVTVAPAADLADGAERLGHVVGSPRGAFTLLNDAFAATAIVVDVPDGAVVDGVIAVRQRGEGAATASFPRLSVRVGRNAQAEVLDVQCSPAPVLTVPVVELDVRAAGRLGYLNMQQHHRGAWQIALQAARVARDATLTAAVAGLGGGYARTRADTTLTGRGATGDLLSAYFGSGHQTLDFRTFQDHAAPDTTSNLLYVGAVADAARSIYTGLIRVRANARGTNAFQTNRNLKLSRDAWAESVPNLEIENNEVRCSHASTVGPVDEDQLYYLESRGVPTPTAKRLIVAGFFDQVLRKLPVRSAARAVRAGIAAKLDALIAPEFRAAA